MAEDNLEKLTTARDKLAQVYKDEACDELQDNGNLINMHQAIIHIEQAIQILKKRENKWATD